MTSILNVFIAKQRSTVLLVFGGILSYLVLPAIMLCNTKMNHLAGPRLDTTVESSTTAPSRLLIGGAILFFKNYYIDQDNAQE